MSIKQFLTFGKMLALLLLVSHSVVAKSGVTIPQFQNQETENIAKTTHAFHTNMLQPQAVHISMMPEHSVKPLHSDYFALFYVGKTVLVQPTVGQTNVVLQDPNRCESVSGLLFPFHFFW